MATMTREQFDALPAEEKAAAARSAQIVDAPSASQRVASPNQMSRKRFDRLSPVDQVAAIRNGTLIIDGIDGPGPATPLPFPSKVPQEGFRWQRTEAGFIQVPHDPE